MYGFYHLYINIKDYSLKLKFVIVNKLKFNFDIVNKLKLNFDILDNFIFKLNYNIIRNHRFSYNVKPKPILNISLLYEPDINANEFIVLENENFIVFNNKVFYVKKLEYEQIY